MFYEIYEIPRRTSGKIWFLSSSQASDEKIEPRKLHQDCQKLQAKKIKKISSQFVSFASKTFD